MLSGNYYLLYFGYTNCPDLTPSTLYYLSSVYRIVKNLPEGAYMKLKIVFISLDPERDSPSEMKKYLANFGKSIIGITASSKDDV
jgi:protein SCO1/2